MDDIKKIIAKNISELRRKEKMTQLELAEKLNYSDKAVSKWERGDSIPDVVILKSIADLFSVTVDYLLTEEHEKFMLKKKAVTKRRLQNHAFITGMSIILVWLIATMVYVISYLVLNKAGLYWLAFIYAVPVSLILWLIFNSIWFNPRFNFWIISLLMWSVVACVYISFLPFGFSSQLLFTLCIPGQLIIIMWSKIKRSKE